MQFVRWGIALAIGLCLAAWQNTDQLFSPQTSLSELPAAQPIPTRTTEPVLLSEPSSQPVQATLNDPTNTNAVEAPEIWGNRDESWDELAGVGSDAWPDEQVDTHDEETKFPGEPWLDPNWYDEYWQPPADETWPWMEPLAENNGV